ncbi:tetratricopeptide (TPR) repeat protein [Hymenobacter luteus]|uniref:Tetratricopeptide (TPR) repeat protein n=2 Tax=Hymenobacter TaxID=89966 RepID=A0A7W9T0H4_9BACT|nr:MULTISPECIES: tetratricopeptide repeat protein [Hymenobacter]MBB4599427.1 tetratricopeptide (TPR) repeat protein [Hymenobacter latericoloratus]MBB6058264.1 tetratricopeptide (TPR) repeat protein [Hymenobacter luteus]
MRLPLLLLLLLLLTPAVGWAQTTPAAADAAQATALRRAGQLVLERKYESAWKLLRLLDQMNQDPAVALQKTSLALNYYTATDELKRFAFRDLKLLDLSPDSLRQLAVDTPYYSFPARRVLEKLKNKYPDNYKLDRALGDYYFTVQQCDCAELDLGEDEVFRRTIQYYQQAHDHGQGDYLSYFALGYSYQRLGQFPESLAPFTRSIQLRPNYPTAHLNLAFVYLELKDFEKAQAHARRAVELFPDDAHKQDAAFLLSQIEERMRATAAKPD